MPVEEYLVVSFLNKHTVYCLLLRFIMYNLWVQLPENKRLDVTAGHWRVSTTRGCS